jgi:acetyl-CoA carboxylase carboxyltransferase component
LDFGRHPALIPAGDGPAAPGGTRSRSELSPTERLELLADPGSLALLPVADEPAVVAAAAAVEGRPVLCYAQDGSVKGGALGEPESAVVVDVLRRSRSSGIPVVSFVESAGARLQEGSAALGAYGRIFFENVALSRRIPQISIITGTSAGGGCYSPALTDFVVMTDRARMFLTGPEVVNEVVHEDVTQELLGGPRVHERNGVCHFVVGDDVDAAVLARTLLSYLPHRPGLPPPAIAPTGPLGPDPAGEVPADARRVYDVRRVARLIVDGAQLLEVSPRWAPNLVTAFARIGGRVVGLIANQPKFRGGVLDIAASWKGAGFVGLCNDFRIPLVVLVDTPGFMPGTRQETGGVIGHGARLVRAFAGAGVRRLTVILRKAYGGGYIAMNAKSLGADLVLAWPTAEIGIIGARAAAKIIHRRELAAARYPATQLDRLAGAYAQRHLSPLAARARGLVDAVVEPARTRDAILAGLAGA